MGGEGGRAGGYRNVTELGCRVGGVRVVRVKKIKIKRKSKITKRIKSKIKSKRRTSSGSVGSVTSVSFDMDEFVEVVAVDLRKGCGLWDDD